MGGRWGKVGGRWRETGGKWEEGRRKEPDWCPVNHGPGGEQVPAIQYSRLMILASQSNQNQQKPLFYAGKHT